jgi:hypothetical protein
MPGLPYVMRTLLLLAAGVGDIGGVGLGFKYEDSAGKKIYRRYQERHCPPLPRKRTSDDETTGVSHMALAQPLCSADDD